MSPSCSCCKELELNSMFDILLDLFLENSKQIILNSFFSFSFYFSLIHIYSLASVTYLNKRDEHACDILCNKQLTRPFCCCYNQHKHLLLQQVLLYCCSMTSLPCVQENKQSTKVVNWYFNEVLAYMFLLVAYKLSL